MPAFEDKLTPDQRWEVSRLYPHVCDETRASFTGPLRQPPQ